jgi:hypothetical protein
MLCLVLLTEGQDRSALTEALRGLLALDPNHPLAQRHLSEPQQR